MFDRQGKILIGTVSVLFVVVMGVFFLELRELENLRIEPVDFMQIEDGLYTGEAHTLLLKAKVNVSVKDHLITDVELIEYQHNRGEDAIGIIDDIINNNSLSVDAISGATQSSNLIKAAVSNALNQK